MLRRFRVSDYLHPTNTAEKIMRLLREHPDAQPREIAIRLWPNTKQISKKAATVQRYLKGLRKIGRHPAYHGFPKLAR